MTSTRFYTLPILAHFPKDTWQALEHRSFDVIILEETLGDANWPQHMGFVSFQETAAEIRRRGMLRPGGRLIAHHFSHSGNPTYEKLQAIIADFGAETAYDGMDVQL